MIIFNHKQFWISNMSTLSKRCKNGKSKLFYGSKIQIQIILDTRIEADNVKISDILLQNPLISQG